MAVKKDNKFSKKTKRIIFQDTLIGVFYYGGKMEKVKCPYCGYEMPIWYAKEKAKSKGVFVKCKGRKCRKEFEIKINVK